MDDEPSRNDEPWSGDDESWRGSEPNRQTPWRDSDGTGWQFPHSLAEVRERWASDTALRVIVGIAAVIVLFCVFAGLGLMWM